MSDITYLAVFELFGKLHAPVASTISAVQYFAGVS
jgi:hypothetical protein